MMSAVRPGKIFIADQADVCVIKLVGDIRVTLCSSIDKTIESIFSAPHQYRDIIIDVMQADAIDSTSLGLLAKLSLSAQQRYGIKPTIFSNNPSITKLLNSVGFNQIFRIVTEFKQAPDTSCCCELADTLSISEESVRQKVIEAHKILMSLNNENRETFRELVNTLEKNNQN